MMKTRIFAGLIAAGFVAAVTAFVVASGSAHAQEANGYKNLKVLPKNIEKKQLKATMKTMAKAVGRKCDDCHDTDAYDKDTEDKKIARKMMRMVNETNQRLSKDGFKDKINCRTCHAGKKEP